MFYLPASYYEEELSKSVLNLHQNQGNLIVIKRIQN